MILMRKFKIRETERGFLFREGQFRGVLGAGAHYFFDPLRKLRVDVLSLRQPWVVHDELELVTKSGAQGQEMRVLDLADHQRALVFVDGRFVRVLGPGLYALWTVLHRIEVEIVDARAVRFEHAKLATILERDGGLLQRQTVEADHVGLLFVEGVHQATLDPGTHAFWKGQGQVLLRQVDLRERILDITGQELMTADKVTLRINAVATFQVVDPLRAVSSTGEFVQALYREAQLALRAAVGARELNALLADRAALAGELAEALKERAAVYGVQVAGAGVRDIILPGEMKQLMNRVIEAKQAAEAALITRREETAAMRSQANTARLLEASPTLMRLRELEVLERVAEHGKLNLVVGEKGLTDRVVNLL